MKSHHHILLTAAAALALASCSSESRYEESNEDLASYEISEEAPSPMMTAPAAPPPSVSYEPGSADAARGPGIDVTAAPGVAFDYRYAFRLPGGAISGMQEQHAAACEALGLDKCRIIGLRYHVQDEERTSAMLALRLDPAEARDFGKKATDAVVGAEGMLVDLQITGTDVGSRIDQSTRDQGRIEADIADLEAELRAMGASDRRRGEVTARLDDLKRQLRSLEGSQDRDEAMLEGTPMVFHYGSGKAIPGFDKRSPIADAFADAGYLFQQVVAFLITLIAALIPIALFGLALRWLWMHFAPASWRARTEVVGDE